MKNKPYNTLLNIVISFWNFSWLELMAFVFETYNIILFYRNLYKYNMPTLLVETLYAKIFPIMLG